MTNLENIDNNIRLNSGVIGSSKYKIYIITYYFPPYNTVGAIRAGKLATFLLNEGHDVHVLCAKGLEFSQDLRSDFPVDRIHHVPYVDLMAPAKRLAALKNWARDALLGLRNSTGGNGKGTTKPESGIPVNSTATGDGLLRKIRKLYQKILGFPDPHIGWYFPAVSISKQVLRNWQPDLIYTTAPPFTPHLVARRLSSKFNVPWIAEYRDRYFEDPYGPPQQLRKKLDKIYEDRLIAEAAGIVTVSDVWSEDYRARFPLPVETIYNGFDPIDFPADVPREPSDPDQLRIVYTGILYHERRDPSPLFEAISLLGEAGKSVKVAFYGTDETVLLQCANRYGVLDQVEIHSRVPYRDSIGIQMQADILLLLQWNDPREIGNVPSKLFEYLASRRPVLGIGIETGIPARILRERDAGVVLNDPHAIAERLTGWLEQKRQQGAIPLLPESVRDGLSRDGQYRKLETFLLETASLRANK